MRIAPFLVVLACSWACSSPPKVPATAVTSSPASGDNKPAETGPLSEAEFEHAFANPSNPKYDETSAADAWTRVLAFLDKLKRSP